jgi:outer membrane protein assembly factor BamB
MSSLRWIIAIASSSSLLGGCAASLPDEKRFGYDLPVNTQTIAAANASEARRAPFGSVKRDGIEYLADVRVSHSGQPAIAGIAAETVATGVLLWHTPFPVPALVSMYDRNEKSVVSNSSVMLAGNRLLVTYRFIIPPQNGGVMGVSAKETFWQYAILDAATGQLLRQERMSAPAPQIEFVQLGGAWFVTDSKRNETARYEPTTGKPLWAYSGVLKFSTVTADSVSLYQNTDGEQWRIIVLDLATGQPIFEHMFAALPLQTLNEVLYHNGQVLVEFGAQYIYNFELGPLYQTYTMAFDARTRKPLWRTPFSKKK